MTGSPVSPSVMSRVHHGLEAEYAQWQSRTLAERSAYVFVDGTYFNVIYADESNKTPILALIGVTAAGQREVIAFTIGERENQGVWENLLDDIKAHGVK